MRAARARCGKDAACAVAAASASMQSPRRVRPVWGLRHIRSPFALVRSGEALSRGGLATVIGTLLIIWLGVGLLVWLLWAVSRVPTLLLGLTARIRRRWHVTLSPKSSAPELVHTQSSWLR